MKKHELFFLLKEAHTIILRSYRRRDNNCSEQNLTSEIAIICDGSTPNTIRGRTITCTKVEDVVTLYDKQYATAYMCGECQYGIINQNYESLFCDWGKIQLFQIKFRK